MPLDLLVVDHDSLNQETDSAPTGVPVLHVINGEHYSGAERVQDLLAGRLAAHGYQVGFACLKPGRFAALRQAKDAPLFEVAMRSRLDPRPVFALAKIIREHGYQIVHTHTARSALIGSLAARWTGVPHVHHLHSPTSADTTDRLANRLNMAIEAFSLRRARIIPVSHSLGAYVETHQLGDRQCVVVPNGVPAQPTLSARRTPTGVWILGTVALFRPRKGLEVLLESLALLRKQGLPVRLRAVGAFETLEYEMSIRRLATELELDEAIDWTGFTRNVSAEFAKMDLFVLPSLFGEGLPMVILEAMAAGVPVVATRVEGAPEAIRDGVDGLIAEAGDPVDLAARISQVISAAVDWQALRASAFARQTNSFSDESMASGVAAVYDRVLATVRSHSTTVLMGTRIDNVTMAEAIDTILERLESGPATQIAFVNADCVNLTYRNEAYRQALADADLVFADGVGMKIAGNALRQQLRDNVNGTDLFPRLCMALVGKHKRIYLLGGKPGIADAVGRWLTTNFPGITICGTRDGYFAAHEEPHVIRAIADSRSDLLLVALGAPKQDLWLHEHLRATGAKVGIGVGGLFDFYSNRVPRAPEWMRRAGLEWFFRMMQEPRRLAKRYLLGNPLFLGRVAAECLKRCAGSPRQPLARTAPAVIRESTSEQAVTAL